MAIPYIPNMALGEQGHKDNSRKGRTESVKSLFECPHPK